MEAIPANVDWQNAKAFATAELEGFNVAGTLESAAYFMAPEVVLQLKFPLDRRHPAAFGAFADEYSTAILDAVIARGP